MSSSGLHEEELLTNFSLVLFLSLETIPSEHLNDMHSLLAFLHPMGTERDQAAMIADELCTLSTEQEGKILVIIDGFDGPFDDASLLSKIVKKQLLPLALALVTCRSALLSSLYCFNYQYYMIGGLDIDQLISSTESVISSYPASITLLKAFPQLHSLCAISYFLNCLLFGLETSTFRPTILVIMELFLNCFLTQCVYRLKIDCEVLNSFLCKMAAKAHSSWSGCCDVPKPEFVSLCNEFGLQQSTAEAIGIFVVYTRGSFPTMKTCYQISPDIFREFLCAKQAVLDHCLPSAVHTIVAQISFACLAQDQPKQTFETFHQYCHGQVEDPKHVLALMCCIFEAQVPSCASHLDTLLHFTLDLSRTPLTTRDCTAIAYTVLCSGDGDRSWKIYLNLCGLSDDHVDAFLMNSMPFKQIRANKCLTENVEVLE